MADGDDRGEREPKQPRSAGTDEPTASRSGRGAPPPLRPFVFDVSKIPGRTNAEVMADFDDAERLLELLGRDLVTRTLVETPKLCVYHETAAPGEAVQPHRHGTYQVSFVLRGALWFGSRCVGPGMGYFTPDKLYAWRAGEEGAEWIEIHSGIAGIYTEPAS